MARERTPEERKDRAIERIKRLLAVKAGHERAATEDYAPDVNRYASAKEAQAAAVLIQELLAEHKLSLTDIEYEEETRSNPMYREAVYPGEYGEQLAPERVKWSEDLADIVAYSYYCIALTAGDCNLVFITGRRTDVGIARTMFLRLARTALYLMQKDRALKLSLKDMSPDEMSNYLFTPQGETTDEKFKTSYLTGFVRGVSERLMSNRLRLRLEAGGSNALVRAERDVELYVRQELGMEDASTLYTPPEDLDLDALYKGMLRGKTVDLEAGGIPALNPKEET